MGNLNTSITKKSEISRLHDEITRLKKRNLLQRQIIEFLFDENNRIDEQNMYYERLLNHHHR